MRKTSSKVIVALDGMKSIDAYEMAATLAPEVWGFKVNDLFVEEGVRCIRTIQSMSNVMVDLKLYDIPNTMNNCIEKIAMYGANIITVHMEPLYIPEEKLQLTLLAGVTLLTSMPDERIASVYLDAPATVEYAKRARGDMVVQFALEAASAGYSYLVCAPTDLSAVKQAYNHLTLPYLPKIICPGIRMAKSSVAGDDQVQVGTPYGAMFGGASYIVVGRPITQSRYPLEVVQALNAHIARAEEDSKTEGGGPA